MFFQRGFTVLVRSIHCPNITLPAVIHLQQAVVSYCILFRTVRLDCEWNIGTFSI